MEGGPQPRNSPAVLPWRCPQTGHGLGDRKVGLEREPARGHTLKFVGQFPHCDSHPAISQKMLGVLRQAVHHMKARE